MRFFWGRKKVFFWFLGALFLFIFSVRFFIFGNDLFFGGGGSDDALSAIAGGNKKEEEKKKFDVFLDIDYGDGAIVSFSGEAYDKETVFDFMKEVLTENSLRFEFKEFSGLGVMVTRIGEKKNGDDGNHYWQFWVNGEYAKVGAGSHRVLPYDRILWKFAKQESF